MGSHAHSCCMGTYTTFPTVPVPTATESVAKSMGTQNMVELDICTHSTGYPSQFCNLRQWAMTACSNHYSQALEHTDCSKSIQCDSKKDRSPTAPALLGYHTVCIGYGFCASISYAYFFDSRSIQKSTSASHPLGKMSLLGSANFNL